MAVVTVNAPVSGQPDSNSGTQKPVTEAQTQGQVIPPASDDPAKAALAKQKQEIIRRARAHELERQKFMAERQAFLDDQTKYLNQRSQAPSEDWKSRLKADPAKFFQESGLSSEELTQAVLNQPTAESRRVQELEAKLAALEAQFGESKSALEKSQQAQYDEAKKQLHNETVRLVSQNAEFEAIKAMHAEEAVVTLIEETFKQTGDLLTVQDAATQVEEHLINEALGIAKLQKIQKKLTPEAAPPAPTAEAPKVASPTITQKQPTTTLTNRIVQASTSPGQTARERRERAIAAFMGAKVQ